ncbi:hypothetical protein CBS101457_006303 [Exobasidium rhododendri]|nr:hypothetical protein CBS101457_006303 [Exobasidium rhododendri]
MRHNAQWPSSLSPFYHSQTYTDRLTHLRSNPFVTHSPSTAYQRSSQITDDVLSRFDQIDVLGGPDAYGSNVGHEGCVNALAWSQSGHCLASGSDDRKIILWKLGSSDANPRSVQHIPGQGLRAHPRLDMAQAEVIQTGHRANIFNVKWAPNCSDRRLFTCAGDCQVRVFDLSRASASRNVQLPSGKEYTHWEQNQGACIRVLKCHTSRAKKISTENSPDVFLTAAEDGEVRQTDLRVPHTCSRSQAYGQGCPRPLMQFQMELYSLSVSKMEPWLFAVAGTSDKVYLQDRRMIPRLLKSEWGSYIDEETAALTHCVRRFSREDHKGGADSITRRERAHVTAVKISEANGRDLIASYSGDGVYRFDIKSDPGKARSEETGILYSSKRAKTDSGSATPQPRVGVEDREWDNVRRRALQALFPSEMEETEAIVTPKTLAHLRRDISGLAEAIEKSRELNACLASERSIIVLCKALLYIKGATLGQSESVELDLDDYRAEMQSTMGEEVKENFVSLMEELDQANKWRAYSEEVKIRILLWDRAEAYIRSSHWGNFVRQDGSMEEVEFASSQSIPHTTTDQSSSSEESLEAEDRDRLIRSLLQLEGGAMDDSDGQFDDGDDDDDDNGSGDDDVSFNFADAESSDEEQSNRHNISGGNAPIVYPAGAFAGHANNETVKDCGFIGSSDEYIWSGSDCGHFFVWSNDEKGLLKGIWKGDSSVVNVLSQHPTLPICAVSGIDETVKIFGPVSRGARRIADAYSRKEEIMQQNSRHET